MIDAAKKDALLALGQYLKAVEYEFITPTPLTHERVIKRDAVLAKPTLRDIFGWSRLFSPADIKAETFSLMKQAGVLLKVADQYKSSIRYSSLTSSSQGQHLFMHSAYPTIDADAVFFGPDSYRFAQLLRKVIPNLPLKKYNKVLDIGTGSGVGGIVAVNSMHNQYDELVLADINPQALDFANINATLADIKNVNFKQSNLYSSIKAPIDLIISNPPYLIDAKSRAYRHGGGEYGSLLSSRIVEEGLPLLSPQGAMILYTASTIVNGQDTFLKSLQVTMRNKNYQFNYEEIDPDLFGEELLQPQYAQADRIAVVSLVVINKSK